MHDVAGFDCLIPWSVFALLGGRRHLDGGQKHMFYPRLGHTKKLVLAQSLVVALRSNHCNEKKKHIARHAGIEYVAFWYHG
jgi:hypothetical protein